MFSKQEAEHVLNCMMLGRSVTFEEVNSLLHYLGFSRSKMGSFFRFLKGSEEVLSAPGKIFTHDILSTDAVRHFMNQC